MRGSMITGHVFIATSLDGFIARENGNIGWLLQYEDANEDHGYAAFAASMDAMIMGRGTFEAVRGMGYWQYPFPVSVLSSTLAGTPVPQDLGETVRFTDESPALIMERLVSEGARRVYVDGGRLVQSFLRQGLIFDMVITRVPVLLGCGRSLFGPLEADVALVHEETRSFPSGLVQSRYRVAA
jgi:dihydrofolate reductase